MEGTIDTKAMATRLKNRRIELGKTVEEVSNATGIGQTAIRNYECGIRIPRYIAMIKLARYYGVSLDALFF